METIWSPVGTQHDHIYEIEFLMAQDRLSSKVKCFPKPDVSDLSKAIPKSHIARGCKFQ